MRQEVCFSGGGLSINSILSIQQLGDRVTLSGLMVSHGDREKVRLWAPSRKRFQPYFVYFWPLPWFDANKIDKCVFTTNLTGWSWLTSPLPTGSIPYEKFPSENIPLNQTKHGSMLLVSNRHNDSWILILMLQFDVRFFCCSTCILLYFKGAVWDFGIHPYSLSYCESGEIDDTLTSIR